MVTQLPLVWQVRGHLGAIGDAVFHEPAAEVLPNPDDVDPLAALRGRPGGLAREGGGVQVAFLGQEPMDGKPWATSGCAGRSCSTA